MPSYHKSYVPMIGIDIVAVRTCRRIISHIGVKSLALFLLSSNLLVRLKPWASALKLKEAKKLTILQAVSEFVVDSKHPSVLSKP
jgi:hypothetical protein